MRDSVKLFTRIDPRPVIQMSSYVSDASEGSAMAMGIDTKNTAGTLTILSRKKV